MFQPNSKILVVDDMLTMRKIIRKNLGELGFGNVAEANDGSAALPLILEAFDKGEKFDLILCDWNMPKVSGLEVLKKLRADDRFKGLPFLMVTAESDKTQVMEALKAGVTHYIVKPFTLDALKDRLEVAYKKTNAA